MQNVNSRKQLLNPAVVDRTARNVDSLKQLINTVMVDKVERNANSHKSSKPRRG